MGTQHVDQSTNAHQLRRFMQNLLNDVRALEQMIDEGMIESGIRRIGAEQEVFIVDPSWHVAPVSMELLQKLDDPAYTTELGRFNVEFNLDPLEFGGDCLTRLEADFQNHLERLYQAAREIGVNIVITGILPTLGKGDLELENLTPLPRYYALNHALKGLRGGEFEFRLAGADELIIKHDSVLVEACNTSCQIHFQCSAEEFVRLYNIAQVVTAPVLAAAVNSPILFGQRLWQETRIALFQQAVDTRSPGRHVQERLARVSFGNDWVRESVVDIFKEDIARFRVIMSGETEEDPFAALNEGRAPKLRSLSMHNGTVYRWNRPCYGVYQGKPHLRIENRTIPSGPTVVDQVANAAFWFGLMSEMASRYEDITQAIEFDVAKFNFLAAARTGLDAQITWLDRRKINIQRLIVDELIEVARSGLDRCNIDSADIDRFMGVIEARVSGGMTGSQWLLDSFGELKGQGTRGEQLVALTAATHHRQRDSAPVHEWAPARIEESGGWRQNYQRVEQYMTTDVFTVDEDEVIDLVANLMDWRHIRHVPVENREHELVGLVSYRSLLRILARNVPHDQDHPIPVSEIMHRDPISVPPETKTMDAIEIMRKHKVACLPVVKDQRLVGIVTEHDFMTLAAELVEPYLREC